VGLHRLSRIRPGALALIWLAVAGGVAAAWGAGAAAGDASTTVPLDHWGYRVVERFEARGVLSGVGDGIKPFTRQEMARWVGRIDSLARAGQVELSGAEAEDVDLLLRELGLEPVQGEDAEARTGASLERARWGRGLATYAHDRGHLAADLLLRQQTDQFRGRGRDEVETVYRNRVGGVLWGTVGDRVGFRLAFEQTREQGSRRYALRDDVYEPHLEAVQLKGGAADYHRGAAYVAFSLPPFVDVQVGKDQVEWGPAPTENLGLGSVGPGFHMVRLRARWGALKLVSIAGALRPCPDRPDTPLCGGEADSAASYVVNGMTRVLDREKYLAAHRLEAAVTPWLDVGFQEVVVYGDRGPELDYLNPIMFYWAAQSYLGDKDNVMMGVDVDLHAGRGLRLYAAYVVDDLKKLRIFSDDFANKFSLQIGGLWVDPLAWRDTDLRAEYVRIEPWIYSHKYPINTFRHFDAPLGHPLGPNSDRWQVAVERRLTGGRGLEVRLARTRHGYNHVLDDGTVVNVGGDLHYGWRPGDERDDKRFLDGVVSAWTQLEGRLSWRPWTQVEMAARYGYEWGDNVPLPPRWGPHVARTSIGAFGDGGQHEFGLDLRYGYY